MEEKIEFSTIPGGVTYRRQFIERLGQLGWGKEVDRARAEEVCGTASAANQFLDKAATAGFLVPVGWGAYRVVELETFETMKRVPNPAFQKLIAWGSVLPRVAPGILFLAPRVWRDTDLSEERPLPIVPLAPEDSEAPLLPPQWGAFAADIRGAETWSILVAGEKVGTCGVPSLVDSAALLRETLDPRWVEAAAELERRARKSDLKSAPKRAIVTSAPRARESRSVGIGLPTVRRIVAPRWYIDARLRGASEARPHG